jgi:tetratricopeptide (TPR) repeat protein
MRAELKKRDDMVAKVREADNWLKASEYDKARDAYSAALEIWPESPDRARVELGLKTVFFRKQYAAADALRQKEDYADARKAFEDIRSTWPDAPDIALVQQAIRECNAKLNQERYEDLVAEGKARLAKKDFAAAGDALEQALEVKPGDRELTQLLEQARNGQVEQRYSDAMNLAARAQAQGKLDEAERYYRSALSIMPNDKRATEQLAAMDAQRRNVQQYGDAMTHGRGALAAGQYGEAEVAFQQALQLRPNDPEAQAALQEAQSGNAYASAMEQGRLALNAQNWDAAKRSFERALQVRPNDPSATAALSKAKSGERAAMVKRGLEGLRGIRIGR